MNWVEGIPVWGEHEEKTINQIIRCSRKADKAALMADGHLGYAVPIGGVVAYKNHVSPSGVGFDIGCGNMAARLDISGSYLRQDKAAVMDMLWKAISFGAGRNNSERVDHEILDSSYSGWDLEVTKLLKDKARNQLGTVGSGNHYVDLFTDELDRVWVGVHFGSRGFGHGIATWFLDKAGATDGMEVESCVLETQSDLGEQYIKAMTLAGNYAYAGREWVVNRVAQLLDTHIHETVHNHHNFAWRETHGGEDYWVVRKGATPAFPGQRGFVGATMTEPAVILEGVEHPLGDAMMYSTVHGAGRVMGRREAAGKWKWKRDEDGKKRLVLMREGKISQEMMDVAVREADVELRGAGTDESPHCYKRLDHVLAAHEGTVKVLHTLLPVGVAMAGADIVDPYKD